MKLSKALRNQAIDLYKKPTFVFVPLTNRQWNRRARIFMLFDDPGRIWGWNITAESNEHRVMILLFAAAIAESEGD